MAQRHDEPKDHFPCLGPGPLVEAGEEADEKGAGHKQECRLAHEARQAESPLHDWFFEDGRFRGRRVEAGHGASSLAEVMESRKGACLALASVYLVMAEQIGVEAVPVATPRHVFIRETTDAGTRNVELLEGSSSDGAVNLSGALHQSIVTDSAKESIDDARRPPTPPCQLIRTTRAQA